MHFYVRRAPFKLTATPYIQHYSKMLFLVIGLKNPCLSFLQFLSLVESQIQTHMNLDGGRAREGGVQYKGRLLFNLKAGEPKGRNVSEGLIGSDTIGKLSGLLRALSSITYKECRNVKAGLASWERRRKKYLMIETFSIHFSLTENLSEK